MKLAEALAERNAAQIKIKELTQRLVRSAKVQEGESPPEDPQLLLRELMETLIRLEQLIVAINRTNTASPMTDGRTVMAGIAQRDVLKMQIGCLDALIGAANETDYRLRGAEIKMVKTVNVAQLQTDRDRLARQYRELDIQIQAVNWTIDLLEM